MSSPSGPPVNPFPRPPQVPAVIALTAWRENDEGGTDGMQSVINTLQNRAARRGTDMYTEAIRPMQYSSIAPPPEMKARDSEAARWPALNDSAYATALQLAEQALDGTLADITGGATNYYALSMEEPPDWAAEMTYTVTIKGQKFFRP